MIKKFISIAITILLLSSAPLIAGINIYPHNITQNNLQNSDDSIVFRSTNILDTMSSALGDKPNYVPNEIIIAFKAAVKQINVLRSPKGIITTGLSSIDLLNRKYHLCSAEKLLEENSTSLLSNVYLFTFPNNTNIPKIITEYNKDPTVECAEPNYLYYPCHIPNDPYFPMQWALNNTGQTGGTPGVDIHAPEAWDIEQGNPDIIIAILDTGVDYTNPDIGNCTEGLLEENYSLESQHPLPSFGYQEIINFSEYDSVSLHISRFDTENFSSSFDISNILKTRIIPKKLFSGYPYNGTGTNIWTKYSEYGTDNTIRIKAQNMSLEGIFPWGFAIDKIKGLIWKPLSEQSSKYADGYDYYYHNPDPMDDMGHGTHCAGIASAVTDNGYGIAGIAGNCTILPIKSADANRGAMSASGLFRGLVFAVNHGARIISMSFGGPAFYIENLALAYANARGVVLIAAAGNDNWNMKNRASPAFYKDVIAVAATDANDSKAFFSNYGSWVDVAAPGVDILSLRAHGTDMYTIDSSYIPGEKFVPAFDNNATLYRASGTSMACPIVAGVAALVLSQNPALTPIQVRTILRSSTDKVSSPLYIGTGRINAHTAVVKTAPVTAELDHTMDDMEVKGTFDIKGIAEGAQFKRYTVEYAYSIYPDEDSWIQLSNSSSPLDGTLASLDTSSLREGLYTIRLQMNASGFTYEDILVVVVNNEANTFYIDGNNSVGPWYGTQGHPFTSIQYAIECCGSSRDEIYVSSGTYSETLSLGSGWSYYSKLATHSKGKSVKIQGEDKNSTILDGGKRFATGLNLLFAKFVTFSGFTIQNYTAGITTMLSSFNTITENSFNDNEVNIMLLDASFNVIHSNNFFNYSLYNIFGGGGVNLWYNPLKLRGNYWSDYSVRYPNAHPRLLASWTWNIPYKVSGLSFSISPNPFSSLLRFTKNNDRFPLVHPL